MSPQKSAEFHTEFCPRESLPVGMRISQAWLPVQVLNDVVVEVEERQRLTLMERFAVEALLTLKSVSPKDLSEVASIPPELGRWLLDNLAQKGLATRAADTFLSVPDLCREALTVESLPSVCEKRLDCLWFPLTNELVLRKDPRPLVKALNSIRPSGSFPLDGVHAGKPLTDVLRIALTKGLVYGDIDGRVRDLRTDDVVKDSVPAYRAAADISTDRRGTWRVTLVGDKRTKRRDGAEPQRTEVLLTVPRLASLVEHWQREYETAKHAALTWLRADFDVGSSTAVDGSTVILASEAFVRNFAEHDLMANGMTVHVRLDREFACEVPMCLEPGDAHAQSLFNVDMTIRELLPSPTTAGDLPNGDIRRVLDRLWHLRLFKTLYELRATGDFAA